ncbi:signal peptidase I, partial [Enterococcus faecalis]
MKNFLKEWGLTLLIMSALVILFTFFLSVVKVSGHSMDPNLADKQRLVMSKNSAIHRYDIVVSKEPGADINIIKRVIGLPGDTIESQNDTLKINGKIQKENYLDDYKSKFKSGTLEETYNYSNIYQNIAKDAFNFTSDFSVTVPENCYFLLGDNRLISKDSRSFGPVPKN